MVQLILLVIAAVLFAVAAYTMSVRFVAAGLLALTLAELAPHIGG
jgi:hypothetical protein